MRFRPAHPRGFSTSSNWARRHLMMLAMAVLGALPVHGQVHTLGAPSPGLLESGVPPFAVFGTEALGLNSPATDLHILPDGRLLLVASRQIVLGDGVRWDLFPEAPQEKTP